MRVFFRSLRCFFFAIRLRRFLTTEPTCDDLPGDCRTATRGRRTEHALESWTSGRTAGRRRSAEGTAYPATAEPTKRQSLCESSRIAVQRPRLLATVSEALGGALR